MDKDDKIRSTLMDHLEEQISNKRAQYFHSSQARFCACTRKKLFGTRRLECWDKNNVEGHILRSPPKVNSKLKYIVFDCGEIDGNALLVSHKDGSTGD